MSTLTDDLRNDFLQIRNDLLAARRDQQIRDCVAHRDAVEAQLAQLDAVLDLYLELFPDAADRTAADAAERPDPVAEAA